MTAIKGIGRRMAHLICKIAKIDVDKRAGEVNQETWDEVTKIISDPIAHGVPVWMVNRRSDYKTGDDLHNSSNNLET